MNKLEYYDRQSVEWSQSEIENLISEYQTEGLNIIQLGDLHRRTPGTILYKLLNNGTISSKKTCRGYLEYKNSELYREIVSKNGGKREKKPKEARMSQSDQISELKNEILKLKEDLQEALILIRDLCSTKNLERSTIKKEIIPPDYSQFSDTPWFDGLSEERIARITTSKKEREFWFRRFLASYLELDRTPKIEYIKNRLNVLEEGSAKILPNHMYSLSIALKTRLEEHVKMYDNLKNLYSQKCNNDSVKISKFDEIYKGLSEELNTILVTIEILIFKLEKEN